MTPPVFFVAVAIVVLCGVYLATPGVDWLGVAGLAIAAITALPLTFQELATHVVSWMADRALDVMAANATAVNIMRGVGVCLLVATEEYCRAGQGVGDVPYCWTTWLFLVIAAFEMMLPAHPILAFVVTLPCLWLSFDCWNRVNNSEFKCAISTCRNAIPSPAYVWCKHHRKTHAACAIGSCRDWATKPAEYCASHAAMIVERRQVCVDAWLALVEEIHQELKVDFTPIERGMIWSGDDLVIGRLKSTGDFARHCDVCRACKPCRWVSTECRCRELCSDPEVHITGLHVPNSAYRVVKVLALNVSSDNTVTANLLADGCKVIALVHGVVSNAIDAHTYKCGHVIPRDEAALAHLVEQLNATRETC